MDAMVSKVFREIHEGVIVRLDACIEILRQMHEEFLASHADHNHEELRKKYEK